MNNRKRRQHYGLRRPKGSCKVLKMSTIVSGHGDISRLVTDKEVVVHPTVLLSVVDHYTRAAKGTNKRVVGTLMGEIMDGNVHVTNAFAVPFEEDARDQTLWFLDHNYHEHLFAMHRKVNRKERVVGWYSTGPKVKPADLEIHELYRQYCADPVYVIVDVQPKEVGLPTTAYYSKEQPTADRTFRRTFIHVPSSIGAFEIEEVGVEHLLRDLKNASTSTLSTQIHDKLSAIKSLIAKLREVAAYLQDVIDGKLPPNPTILYNLQNIFNLLPDLNSEDLTSALSVQTNDSLLSLYLGSVVRSVMALHNLINNKLENKRKLDSEQQKEGKSSKGIKSEKPKDKAKAPNTSGNE